MADLPYIQEAQEVKITGQDSTGTTVNYVTADTSGSLQVIQYDRTGSGTIAALNGVITANTQGSSTIIFNVTGTWSAVITPEGTTDGTNWFMLIGANPPAGTFIFPTFNTNQAVTIPCGGCSQVRLRASTYTSGTVAVAWENSNGVNCIIPFQPFAGALQSTARINDTSGNGITSTLVGAKQSLDVNITAITSATTALTANSPTAASIGVASASALVANANRTGLVLTNTSNATISLGLGVSAVLNSGITLYPGGVWSMDQFTFTKAAINAIAGLAASNLSIQEFS